MSTKPSETPACSASELQAIERAESVVTDALAAIRNPYLAGRLESIRQQLGGLNIVAKIANKRGIQCDHKDARVRRQPDASGVALTSGLGGCPRCGDTDLQAAAPDWTDAGISAEMTCPRCEHQWTAHWVVTLTPPNPESPQPSASVDDLAALVRKLSYALTKANPASTLPERAMDYLKRHGLQGSPLRGQGG